MNDVFPQLSLETSHNTWHCYQILSNHSRQSSTTVTSPIPLLCGTSLLIWSASFLTVRARSAKRSWLYQTIILRVYHAVSRLSRFTTSVASLWTYYLYWAMKSPVWTWVRLMSQLDITSPRSEQQNGKAYILAYHKKRKAWTRLKYTNRNAGRPNTYYLRTPSYKMPKFVLWEA